MSTINMRLARLEHQQGADDQQRAQIEADAALVINNLNALAAGFEEGDADADAATQITWSAAQRLAWSMRFQPEVVASGLMLSGQPA